MTREIMKNDIPQLWKDRAKVGLCPVCGKEKGQFEKKMIIYCSSSCRDEYAKRYTFWGDLRHKILSRDHQTCQCCGMTEDKFLKEKKGWKEAQMKKVTEEVLENSEYRGRLETLRAKKLVELSNWYEEEVRKVLDDSTFLFAWRYDFPELEGKLKIKDYEISFCLEVDHIVAVCNGGDMWDEKNLRTLCKQCHLKKTKTDLKEAQA